MDSIAKDNFSNFQLNVAALPRFEEVRMQAISKKYLIKLQVGTAISFLFFIGGLITAFYFSPPEVHVFLWVGIGLVILIFGWTFFNNIMYINRSGYALREQDVIFKRGFLFEKTTIVPFNRIQHVSVERSFLDKLLNISTVKVFTAGGSGSDISIPGIIPETAASIKEEISSRIYAHA